jgi:hypothetical protein
MADAAAIPGQVNRLYISSTVYAEDADSAAILSAHASGFVRADNILSDVKKSDSRATADRKERGRDFSIKFPGGRTISITGKVTKRPGNSAYDILEAAYLGNTQIAVAAATGDIATTGTKSLCFNAIVTKWDEDQPDPGATTHDVELAPGPSAVNPTIVTKS